MLKVLDVFKLLGWLHKLFDMTIINNPQTWECYEILTLEPSCTLIWVYSLVQRQYITALLAPTNKSAH
jgi:hypothetical protein